MSRFEYPKRRKPLLYSYPVLTLLLIFFTPLTLVGQEKVKRTDWSLSAQTGYLFQGEGEGFPGWGINAAEGYAFDLVLEARQSPGFSLVLTQSLRISDSDSRGVSGTSFFLPYRGQLTHLELLLGPQGNLRIGSGDLSLGIFVGPGVYWYRRQTPTGVLVTEDAFSERALVERYRGVFHLGARASLKYTHWFSPDFGLSMGGNFILSALAQLGGTERVGDRDLLLLRDQSGGDRPPALTIPEPSETPGRPQGLTSVTPAINFFVGFTVNL